ncbi:MAG TPA: pseudouridine synthase [Nitrolancea sp.]|nr:pseudouridine synthase [Nitrolancea sp.]
MERLHHVIASHGLTSRRKAEQMIASGRVSVDGQIVREMGVRVDPQRQTIRVDGKVVKWERRRYLILNKPSGYITTAADERGRRTVLDLVDVPERVVPVGRLDRKTSGLLLLTNDGELLYRITHPKFELEKEYEAMLDGFPPPAALERLRRGITVDGVKVAASQVRPLRNEETGTVLRIVIHEGRNRIVRRMLEQIGYPAIKLQRTRVGPLHVRGLPSGAWRDLTPGELEQIRESVGLNEAATGRETLEERRSSQPVAGKSGAPGRPRGGSGGREQRRTPGTRGTFQGGRSGGGNAPRNRDRRPGGSRQEHSGRPPRKPD